VSAGISVLLVVTGLSAVAQAAGAPAQPARTPAQAARTPAQAAQAARAPARSLVRVLLVGDSVAFTLGIGLAAHARAYGVVEDNGAMLGCGVAMGAETEMAGVVRPTDPHCRGTGPAPQWPQLWTTLIHSFRPAVVLILAGRWEVLNRTYRGRFTNILHPAYADYVRTQLRRADDVARSAGASVVFLTAPCTDSGRQRDGRPWPEDSPRRLAVYNGLVRQVAGSSPRTSVIDFDAMACPGGHYRAAVVAVARRAA
jgi:hypothetical protein